MPTLTRSVKSRAASPSRVKMATPLPQSCSDGSRTAPQLEAAAVDHQLGAFLRAHLDTAPHLSRCARATSRPQPRPSVGTQGDFRKRCSWPSESAFA
jgi:hypothetical protein